MNESSPIAPQRARLLVVGAVILSAVGGLFFLSQSSPKSQLDKARLLQSTEHYAQSQALASAAFTQDSTLTEAALIAAQCALNQNHPEEAVAILETVPAGDSEWHQRCHELLAQTCHDPLARLRQAEAAYRSLLAIEPDHKVGNEGLARLLGQTARRREAVEPVLRLIRAGVETDHLMLIARERGVISDPELLQRAQAEPHAASALLGLAWHAAEARDAVKARTLLEQAVTRDSSLAPAWGALGQRLFLDEDEQALLAWEQQLPTGISNAEVWLARAGLSEHLGDDRSAIRCYGEAVQLAPESRRAVSNLSRLLARQGAAEESRKMATHLAQLDALEVALNRCFSSGQTPDIDDLLDLIGCFERAGRLWEVVAWSGIARDLAPRDPRVVTLLSQLPNNASLALEQTDPTRNPARSIDWSVYPLPVRTTGDRAKPLVSTPVHQTLNPPPTFQEEAHQLGFAFQFDDGTRGEPRLRMQQITGGGIGVIDYDLDHHPDLFYSQGGGPLIAPEKARGDRLFRNITGQRFIEIAASAGIMEDDFGQGVAVGDIDGDGFPDLYVAGIGINRLWLNNGDGTFSDVTAASGLADDRWTTSCLIADLNSDGHPDIYDVNYLAGEKLFEQVCRAPDGTPTMCMPFDFDGAVDRVWLSDGAGHFRDATAEMLDIVPNGKGLGIVAWSADGTGKLSLLIANDTTANFYFAPSAEATGPRLRERAVPTGLALSESGKAQGCMGIALGDVDGDGQMEACLTNFLAEANVFYRGVGSGFYEDQTRRVGLFETTLDSLGFGTQFLDANLDGEMEIAFANGHLQNLEQSGRPYRMPPKLFTWRTDRFQPVEAKSLGPYFEKRWLARAMARLDWNSDGREDLAISHLDDPSALLTNTTATPTKTLSLQLIATHSAREAIGATVHIKVGDRTWVKPITAGDGYQVSNDRRVIWGAGAVSRIDSLTIHWPSGHTEEFGPVDLPCAGIAREGTATLLRGP